MQTFNKKTLSPGWADHTSYITRPASDFWSQKSDFPEWLQSHTCYDDAAIPNAPINDDDDDEGRINFSVAL